MKNPNLLLALSLVLVHNTAGGAQPPSPADIPASITHMVSSRYNGSYMGMYAAYCTTAPGSDVVDKLATFGEIGSGANWKYFVQATMNGDLTAAQKAASGIVVNGSIGYWLDTEQTGVGNYPDCRSYAKGTVLVTFMAPGGTDHGMSSTWATDLNIHHTVSCDLATAAYYYLGAYTPQTIPGQPLSIASQVTCDGEATVTVEIHNGEGSRNVDFGGGINGRLVLGPDSSPNPVRYRVTAGSPIDPLAAIVLRTDGGETAPGRYNGSAIMIATWQ